MIPTNMMHEWEDPALHFLTSGFLPDCRVRWDNRFDEFQALQLSVGRITLLYDDTAYDLDGTWFWWGFAGPRVRFHPTAGADDWQHRYVTLRGPQVALWAAQGLLFQTPQIAPSAGGACQSFDGLLTLLERTDRWGQRRAVNLMEQMLLELADARAQSAPSPPWLEPLLKDLEAAPFAPDYPALAARHGLSLSSLRAHFRRARGVTLHEHVLQTRLSGARTLLAGTDLPIKTIAEQLGYRDVYYFSRQFRQYVGIPPLAYRRSRQGTTIKSAALMCENSSSIWS